MGISKKDLLKKEPLSGDDLLLYEDFRHNLRLLRNSTGLSAEKLGKELGFPKHHRVIDLEYGRSGVPKLQEIIIIAKFFKISVDDLLFKKVKISFE